jgi:hypothetical protein
VGRAVRGIKDPQMIVIRGSYEWLTQRVEGVMNGSWSGSMDGNVDSKPESG